MNITLKTKVTDIREARATLFAAGDPMRDVIWQHRGWLACAHEAWGYGDTPGEAISFLSGVLHGVVDAGLFHRDGVVRSYLYPSKTPLSEYVGPPLERADGEDERDTLLRAGGWTVFIVPARFERNVRTQDGCEILAPLRSARWPW